MQATEPKPRARLPLAVVALGLTSFFTDAASEMIFPLLPAFLVTLGAGAGFLGLIEGLADAIASLLKLASGYAADRFTRKRPMVLFGYGVAAFVRPLFALATAPWHVLLVRATDRIGKGVRSSPRDVLIAKAAEPGQLGRAFGFHRAMDHAGAVVGPLLATLLLWLGLSLRQIFWVAIIPGFFSLLCILVVKESPDVHSVPAPSEADAPPSTSPALPLPVAFKGYLAILLLFSLGNSSDAFLLLRARELGIPVGMIAVLWMVLHVSKLVSSYLGGDLSDRMPRAKLITAGWAVYALTYLGLGLATRASHVWLLFIVYGTYYGLTEPAEKALVKELAPAAGQGKAFGYYNFIVGVSAVPAGLLTGGLWQHFGPLAALATGAGFASCASLALAIFQRATAARA